MKTNKKWLFLPIVSTLTLTPIMVMSCDKIQNDNAKDIIRNDTDFVHYGSEYNVYSNRLPLYRIKNKELPYVEISEMINTLDGFFNARKIWAFKNIFTNSKSYFNNGIKLQVNWYRNTITIKNLDFFNFTNNTSNTNYSQFLQYTDIRNINNDFSNEITFNLNDYGFDILYYKGKVLIPLAIFNTLFCAGNYYSLYYNGSKVIGSEFWLNDKYMNIEKLKDGAYNSFAKFKKITEQYRKDNYNLLKFAFDYYYGLKNNKKINKMEDYIPQEIKQKILSTDVDDNNEGYAKLFFGKLNELHTRMTMLSFFNQKDKKLASLNANYLESEKNTKYINLLNKLQAKRYALQNIDSENDHIRFKNDTVILTLNSFKTGSQDKLQNQNEAWKYDSYYFMKKAMAQIKEYSQTHTKINKIVLDLSTNGGGNIAAMRRVLGFLKTNQAIYTYNRNSLSNEIYAIATKTDTNGDGYYDEKDGYSEYKWYVLTSFNTFSAANEFTAITKNINGATIIGEKSGGGMCSILPLVLPDGTTSVISSNNQGIIYDKQTNTIKELEDGIDPDYSYSQDNFYDDNKLVNFIKNLA